MELKPATQAILGFVILFVVLSGALIALRWAREVSRIEPAPAASVAAPVPAPIGSSDPRVAAAIIALAEDNVKLRAAYASAEKRAAEWERRAREKGE